MQIRCFSVESDEDMQKCLDIRRAVFIEEQSVAPEIESDGRDDQALHFAVRSEENVIGTCRVRMLGSAAKIERVAVLKEYRSKGIGGVLMKFIIQELDKSGDVHLFKLSSQAQAVPFYEKLGFKKRGGEYMDAGIPHYDMVMEKQDGK